MGIQEPRTRYLEELLYDIRTKKIVLPKFKRDFIWGPEKIISLLESISKSYHCGSLLFLENKDEAFAYRPIPDEIKPERPPEYLIFDGQQRLSSLYFAFYGDKYYREGKKYEDRYYLDLKRLIELKDISGSFVYVDSDHAYRSHEEEFENMRLPLTCIFSKDYSYDEWVDDFKEYRKKNYPDDYDKISEAVKGIKRNYLKEIYRFKFPVIELTGYTDEKVACDIFAVSNISATPLNTFEILTAKLWPHNIDLRELWKSARKKYPLLDEFEIDPATILKGLSMVTRREKGSFRTEDLYRLEAEDFDNYWDDLVKSFSDVVALLKEELGVVKLNRLPYESMVPAMAALSVDIKDTYRGLFRRNPSALYTLDDKGRFFEINQRFTEITGYEIDDLRDKTIEDLFSKKDETLVTGYHQKKTAHKDLPFEYEMPLITKSGREIIVNIRANVDTRGKFAVGSIDDITERKNMEQQLKEYAEQLEQKVEARIRDVRRAKGRIEGELVDSIEEVIEVSKDVTERVKAQQKLEEYSKELEHSNKLKDIFIDIMRHDLLTHVGIIENSSEFILDGESDGEKRELILTINRSAERLIEMIQDASKFAMVEELEAVDLKTFDVKEALKEALEIYEPSAKEKNITLESSIDRSFVFKASPLIKDIFSNLLSNAIKYSPRNTKIVVEIQEGPPCTIAVKDNGPGVPDKEKEMIFERFIRGSKKGVKGTGLGLAIVKRIVDLHKGRVWVEDNPEGGSIFKVEIPA